MTIYNNDTKNMMFDKTKNNIIKNLINTRKTISGGANMEEITTEYDQYFNKIKKEKEQQINVLKSILEHLEKLNNNTKNLQDKSKKITDDTNKIKLILSDFQNDLNNIEK